MLETGSRLFDFSLENQYGELIETDQLNTGRALIVFYPWAFSRVCGSELEALQENADFFTEHHVRIIAISVDHKFTLRNYAHSLGLQFDLLADFWPHGQIASLADAFDESRGVALRKSFYVVDGVIRHIFVSAMTSARDMETYKKVISETID